MEAPHIPLIVEVHAEEAAIHWLRRDRAVDAPHFNRKFLARLDERLEANVDGLRVAGQAGLEIARAAFDSNSEPGEAFTLAALAFTSRDAGVIGDMLDILAADEEGSLLNAAISALGWLDPGALGGLVQPLLDDPRPPVRALGLGAASVHRVDPGEQLGRFLQDAPPARGRAIKLAGQLGRTDLLPQVQAAIEAAPDLWFEAGMAAVLLGDRGRGIDALLAYVAGSEQDTVRTSTALELAALAAAPGVVESWLGTLRTAARERALRASGALGQPGHVPWLIGQMSEPALARIAGESFSTLTGADLELLDLEVKAADEDPLLPTDDPEDEDVDLPLDADLAVPDPSAVAAWWAQNGDAIPKSGKIFLGRAATEETYRDAFRTGYQRQRRLAALALALGAPNQPLPNWRSRER